MRVAILVALVWTVTACRSDHTAGVGWEGTRAAVLAGATRDFRDTVGVPPGFAHCFVSAFGRALTDQRLEALARTHESRGEPAAARVLNDLGAPVGDSCGGRRWVPELIGA